MAKESCLIIKKNKNLERTEARSSTSACFNDPTAIMYSIKPDLLEGRRACVDVEDSGRLTSGQTVADWTGRWGRPLQTLVLMKVDRDGFEKEFIDRLARLTMFKPNAEDELKRAEEQIEVSEK